MKSSEERKERPEEKKPKKDQSNSAGPRASNELSNLPMVDIVVGRACTVVGPFGRGERR
jgi:hypothetical protein